MDDRPYESESRILELQAALERLEQRVAGIESVLALRRAPEDESLEAGRVEVEGREPAAGWTGQDQDAEEDGAPSFAELAEKAGANIGAVLVGGILLVLAGAYLLRALTEAGLIPRVPGIVLALVYALGWVGIGHVMARRGRRDAASAGGLAAAMVALPVIWESTSRFQVFGPWMSAVMLVLVGVVLLSMAERHRLAPASVAAAVGIGGVSIGLMFGTRRPEPFFLVLVLLSVAASAAGPKRGGPLPWLCYLMAGAGALLLMGWSAGERAIARPSLTVWLLVGFFVATTAIIVLQSARTGRIGGHGVFQGTLVTLLGFGGALVIGAHHLPGLSRGLAMVVAVLGMGGYAFLLFTFRWSREHRWVFLFHSSLALVVVAMCAWTLLPQPAWLFSVLAVLLALTGVGLDRVSPGLHAAMAVVFATLSGELAGEVFGGLVGREVTGSGLGAEGVATLVAAVLCACLPLKDQSPVWPEWLPRVGRGMVILVAVLGIDAVVVLAAASAWTGDGVAVDPAMLATLRTGVLAVSVAVLAWGSRFARFHPARILVWPLLMMIGLKLVAEDFPRGRAITMAISLLLSGGGLIVAGALLRRRNSGPESTDTNDERA